MTDDILFGIISSSWILYSSWWIFQTWYINPRYSQPLHRIITFFLIFKSLNCIFTLTSISLCNIGEACYWDLAVNSTYTIYNTFMYTHLLLISKGFNIIKEYLNRSELTFVAMGMGSIYLGYSCYSIRKANFILMLALIISAALYSFTRFTMQNLKKLNLRKRVFLSHMNNTMVLITQQKINLFRRFLKLTSLMLTGKILYLMLKWMQVKNQIRMDFTYISIADDLSELLTASAVTFLVRAKFRGYLYDMHSEQIEHELRPLTHFLQAKVPKGFRTEIKPNLSFLVVTPKGKFICNQRNFLLANPVNLTQGK